MSSGSWLAPQISLSPTKALAILRPKGKVMSQTLVGSLMLTSLVDAFSILVIFLLMNTSNSFQEVEMKTLNGLPSATNSDVLKKGVILTVENNQYKVNGETVPLSRLTEVLRQEKGKMEAGSLVRKVDLIIQAARGADYDLLSPILVAASQAEFQHYKLAVVELAR